jgi:hypothetical protein
MKHNDQNLNEGYSSTESQNALSSLKSVSAEPSLYFKTRILAQAREQQKAKSNLFKKFFASVALAACLVLAVTTFIFKNKSLSGAEIAFYKTGQPYVIRVDIRPYKESKIAYAEVVLDDDNVQFSSSRFENISQQKKLVVSWENVVEKQFLPIVIKGLQTGASVVKVNFYDSENKLINSQNVNLNFKGG